MVKKHARWSPNRVHSQKVCLRIALLLAIICFGMTFPITNVVAVDSFWTSSNSGDWFDAQNWGGPIPNAPGDIAHLLGIPDGDINVALASPVTLGQLDIFGQSTFTLSGPGPLLFDNPGADAALLRVVTLPKNHVLAVPLGIADGELLMVDVPADVVLTFDGGIAVGNGDLVKKNGGTVKFSGASLNWDGMVTIDGGEVRIEHTKALQNSSVVTAKPNSVVTVVSQDATVEDSRDFYVIPRMKLDGATLQTNLGASREVTRLETNIDLLSDSVIQVPTDDFFFIRGNLSGPGGVFFQQRVDPAVSVGLSNRTFLEIDGATSYSGETFIGPNMRVAFRQSAALGDSSAGTLVDRGTLELHAGGGSEQIEVRHGRLALIEAVDPYGHEIFLDQGQLFGGDDDGLAATLNTTVNYSGGVALGTESGGDNLVLAGGISGTGSVFSLNQVEIRGELSARGNFVATSRGPASLSGKLSQAGDVFVSDTRLILSGDLESPRGAFFLNPDFTVASLVAKQSNTLESVVIDPRSAERVGFHEQFRLGAEVGAVLTITDELRYLGGTLQGAITGQEVLTKKDRTPGVLENIRGSEFTRVDVEAGQLTIRGDAGDSPPEIRLGTHDTSRLVVENAGTYHGDIFLNNARGSSQLAALAVSGNTILAGNIYLGDRGSSLSSGEVAEITGVIHGGDFTVMRRSEIRLGSGNHTYTGATHVLAENLRLVDAGVLNSTSMIVGNGRIGTGGGRAGLVLDNSGAAAHNDRIPDATPVHLNGMKLTLLGRDGEQVTETLGAVHATRGMSEIVVDNPAVANSETALVIETLDRQPGGALRFDLGRNGGQVRFATAPTLDDGLVGGWAVVRGYRFTNDQDFATYGPSGVVAYSDLHSYSTDLLVAAPSDNVDLLGQQVSLTSDHNINALRIRDSDINLNSHTLTLESGGLIFMRFGDMIGGGQLTAGTSAGAELLVSGIGTIEADIVDNAHGPVGLTYASNSGALLLSGNNTYTGSTVFSAGAGSTVQLLGENALPMGTDLTISGTDLRIAYDSANPLVLGHLEVRDNGLIRPTAGNPPSLQPTSIHIESGVISGLDIVGDVPITKTTHGSAFFGRTLANHTGSIEIERGRLVIDALGPAPLDDDHAVTVRRGASLRTTSDFVIADRKLRLDGGILDIELRGRVSAPIEILAGGGFIRNERGTTAITSPIAGQGPLVVEGGFGNGVIAFEADLNAFEGPLRFTGGTTAMRGSNANYSQPIEVAASRLTVSGTNVFGTGEVTILPEGRLNVVNSVTGNLVLAGGALGMAPSNTLGSPTLRGDLSITEDSYLFISPLFDGRRLSPVVESTLRLADQTNLSISPDIAGQPDRVAANVYRNHVQERITLSGDIVVLGEASMTSFDASVRLAGTIRPGTENATLNLVGNDTFDFRGSIQLEEAKSLAVTIDGEVVPLALTGSRNSLAGRGTYIGDIAVSLGASIVPGDSSGELTVVGDTTVGEGAIYEWEIADNAGIAGVDWDLLHVEGDLFFEATAENPWVLEIIGLPGFDLRPSPPWLIASADSIDGFDLEAVQFDISEIVSARPSLTVEQFSLYAQGGNLILQFVPEPSSWMLAGIGFVLPFSRLRRRCHLK